mgnify:CR=1 FL=1
MGLGAKNISLAREPCQLLLVNGIDFVVVGVEARERFGQRVLGRVLQALAIPAADIAAAQLAQNGGQRPLVLAVLFVQISNA